MPSPSPSTLTVYKLQLLTARKKEWRPATADSLPHAVTCQHCDTHYVSRHRTHDLVRCTASRATETTEALSKHMALVVVSI